VPEPLAAVVVPPSGPPPAVSAPAGDEGWRDVADRLTALPGAKLRVLAAHLAGKLGLPLPGAHPPR
jgi:hypothetical protein